MGIQPIQDCLDCHLDALYFPRCLRKINVIPSLMHCLSRHDKNMFLHVRGSLSLSLSGTEKNVVEQKELCFKPLYPLALCPVFRLSVGQTLSRLLHHGFAWSRHC